VQAAQAVHLVRGEDEGKGAQVPPAAEALQVNGAPLLPPAVRPPCLQQGPPHSIRRSPFCSSCSCSSTVAAALHHAQSTLAGSPCRNLSPLRTELDMGTARPHPLSLAASSAAGEPAPCVPLQRPLHTRHRPTLASRRFVPWPESGWFSRSLRVQIVSWWVNQLISGCANCTHKA